MEDVTQFLIRHGGLVLFAVVFAEQVGLPIPAVPVLLAAGALAGAGKMNVAWAILLGFVACLIGDLIWYYLGRYRGRQVLGLLCRISLEPDSCVRRTEDFFIRHGMRSLIFAKFIPGLSTVTPALAGLFDVNIGRFFLYNGLGALLWTVAFVMPGYLFSNQLERVAAHAARFGSSAVVLVAALLALYVMYKYIHRRRLLRELRIARISVDELKQMMDAGCDLVIVDLRQRLDVEADPYTIPGAIRMAVEELEQRHHEIPRDRDVILFCACPNEVTAARMALLLKRNGITRVRPLAGGVEGWRARNFPVDQLLLST
ncbi:MAG: sulfurtransferase [Nitrospirae bacterium]|nr:MAG: sulfurtransferase [Nitrospirota bacterium]